MKRQTIARIELSNTNREVQAQLAQAARLLGWVSRQSQTKNIDTPADADVLDLFARCRKQQGLPTQPAPQRGSFEQLAQALAKDRHLPFRYIFPSTNRIYCAWVEVAPRADAPIRYYYCQRDDDTPTRLR